MPVLKVKKNGTWEELGGTSPSDGGNADTLDGKHANYFATASDVVDLQSKVVDIDNDISNKISLTTKTVTLPTSGWSSNKQTVSVSGVTANNTVVVTYAPLSYAAYSECGVRCISQASGTLTFQCEDVPSVAITVNIAIFE